MIENTLQTGCACAVCLSLRHARWYKRLQARILSMENARYARAVESRKSEVFGRLEGDVVEIGPELSARAALRLRASQPRQREFQLPPYERVQL